MAKETPSKNTASVSENSVADVPMLSYKNNNAMKAEVLVNGKTIVVGPKQVLTFPAENFAEIKPLLIGSWLKISSDSSVVSE